MSSTSTTWLNPLYWLEDGSVDLVLLALAIEYTDDRVAMSGSSAECSDRTCPISPAPDGRGCATAAGFLSIRALLRG